MQVCLCISVFNGTEGVESVSLLSWLQLANIAIPDIVGTTRFDCYSATDCNRIENRCNLYLSIDQNM